MEKARVGDPSWGIHFHSCCEGGMRDNKNKNGVSQAEANGGCLSDGSPLSNNVFIYSLQLLRHYEYGTKPVTNYLTALLSSHMTWILELVTRTITWRPPHCLWDDQGLPCFIWRRWGRRESINVGPRFTIMISEFERRCNCSKFN